MRVTYNPAVFDAADLDSARRIILTAEPDGDTDARWVRETPYVTELVVREIQPAAESLVLDYGCGVGRLSKALIEATGCRVLGVDLSTEMRRLAVDYVASDRFEVIDPAEFETRVRAGLRVDGALAVWVIQHCLDADATVRFLAYALAPERRMFVLNTIGRCVPVVEKPWANDGADVRRLLRQHLEEVAGGTPDPASVGPRTAPHTFWGSYRRRAAAT